jgi:hypothetical protein
MSDGGKGSGRRPQTVADDQVADNWSNIFGLSRLEKLKRQQALDKLAEINQELGLYDESDSKPTQYNSETQEVLSR